jgi:hypothetical protein
MELIGLKLMGSLYLKKYTAARLASSGVGLTGPGLERAAFGLNRSGTPGSGRVSFGSGVGDGRASWLDQVEPLPRQSGLTAKKMPLTKSEI